MARRRGIAGGVLRPVSRSPAKGEGLGNTLGRGAALDFNNFKGKKNLGGFGDLIEPFASTVLPGSLRKKPKLRPIEKGSMAAAFAEALRSVIEEFGGLPVRQVECKTWEAFAYVIGVNPVRIDLPIRRDRRSLTVINTHVANQLWIGPTQAVAVNSGAFLAPNGGNISIPLNEDSHVFAVSNGAGTISSIVQYA